MFICAFIATAFVVSLVIRERLVDTTALLRLYAKRITLNCVRTRLRKLTLLSK